MMTLGATLYVQDSKGAVAFYCQAFNMTIGYNALHPEGTYLHAELEKDGNSLFAVSESPDAAIRKAMLAANQPTMSLGINFGTNEELQHAYESLIKEGRILRPIGPLPWTPLSADVVDRYGVCWYLYVSQHRPD